jgi:hypothetical protein
MIQDQEILQIIQDNPRKFIKNVVYQLIWELYDIQGNDMVISENFNFYDHDGWDFDFLFETLAEIFGSDVGCDTVGKTIDMIVEEWDGLPDTLEIVGEEIILTRRDNENELIKTTINDWGDVLQ